MQLVSLDAMFGRRAAGDSVKRPVVGEAYNVHGKKMVCTATGLRFFYVVAEAVWEREREKPSAKRNFGSQSFLPIVEIINNRVKKWTDSPTPVSPIPELENLADPDVSPIANGPVNDVALRAALIRDMQERMKGLDLRPADPEDADAVRSKLMKDLGVEDARPQAEPQRVDVDEILREATQVVFHPDLMNAADQGLYDYNESGTEGTVNIQKVIEAGLKRPLATKKKAAAKKVSAPRVSKKTLIKRKPKMENVVASL